MGGQIKFVVTYTKFETQRENSTFVRMVDHTVLINITALNMRCCKIFNKNEIVIKLTYVLKIDKLIFVKMPFYN